MEENPSEESMIEKIDVDTAAEFSIEINEDDEHLIKLFAVYNLEYEPEPIKMFIDSYGGEVYSVFGLLAIMESSKVPIHTIATGAAMSCGFLMLISGHKRFAHKYATPLYHQVSSWSHGKLEDMKEDLKEGKRLQKTIEEIIIRKTKLTKKKLKEINSIKKDWFLLFKNH